MCSGTPPLGDRDCRRIRSGHWAPRTDTCRRAEGDRTPQRGSRPDRPDRGPHPQQSVPRLEGRPGAGPRQDFDLMPQGDVLKRELASVSGGRPQSRERVSADQPHRRLPPGGEPRGPARLPQTARGFNNCTAQARRRQSASRSPQRRSRVSCSDMVSGEGSIPRSSARQRRFLVAERQSPFIYHPSLTRADPSTGRSPRTKSRAPMVVKLDPDHEETRAIHDLIDFTGLAIVEVGCGDGRLTRRYADAAASIFAFDNRRAACGARQRTPTTRANTHDHLRGRRYFGDGAPRRRHST